MASKRRGSEIASTQEDKESIGSRISRKKKKDKGEEQQTEDDLLSMTYTPRATRSTGPSRPASAKKS